MSEEQERTTGGEGERPPRRTPEMQVTKSDEGAAPEPEVGGVASLFREVLPDVVFGAEQQAYDVALTVSREDLVRVMEAARRDPRLAFDYFRFNSGVDYQAEGLEVVYGLYSLTHKHSVIIKVRVPQDDAWVPTLVHLWKGANWHERETREMFGIEFRGHPDPRNLLLDEDLDIHPLRKDHPLAEIELKQGENVF
ncbi:MAG TPA: NADH-quinone oxidoreductase subunit C [Dehalococcoidia bacterium]